MEVACRLAADRHASITALTVIEIPPLLPLDAHMRDEEAAARRLLARAEAIGDAYGVSVVSRSVRSRDAASAILERMDASDVELVVLGARRRERANKRAPAFGGTVQHVLRKATCRVLVVGAPCGSNSSAAPPGEARRRGREPSG
jgi:nucleotide-binding universal stress UspA family protein